MQAKKHIKKYRILEANETLDEIKELDKEIDYTKIICVHANGKTFDFIIFKGLGDLIRSTFYADFLMTEAENKQNEMETLVWKNEVWMLTNHTEKTKNNLEKKFFTIQSNFLKEEE